MSFLYLDEHSSSNDPDVQLQAGLGGLATDAYYRTGLLPHPGRGPRAYAYLALLRGGQWARTFDQDPALNFARYVSQATADRFEFASSERPPGLPDCRLAHASGVYDFTPEGIRLRQAVRLGPTVVRESVWFLRSPARGVLVGQAGEVYRLVGRLGSGVDVRQG